MKNIKNIISRTILIYLVLFVSGTLSAQITLNIKDKKLRQVIQQIEKESGYSFFYNSNIAELEQKVNFQIKDSSIEKTLQNLLANTNISYVIKDNNQVVLADKRIAGVPATPTVNQQEKGKTITGNVKDNTGNELIGVGVVIKGTTTGTATDVDGNFTIENVPEGAIIQVRYIGFLPQEIRVANQTRFNIVMLEDVKILDEVVVVGYTTQRKADLTGAVSSVKMDNINDLSVSNINSALQGRMSGVTILQSSGVPGASTGVRIRGLGTFGNNDPLYVIDGVPADNMNDINPGDIERIDVLKDAASAAIYGSRAANGVVIIQTKQGANNGKVNISFNTHHGFSMPGKKMKLLNAEQRNMIHMEAFENAKNDYPGESFDMPDYYTSDYAKITRTDWLDEIMSNSAYQGNYDVSVSGANDIVRYNIMGGHLTQDGVLKNSGFDRTNFRVNTEVNITKNFKVGENLMITHSKQSLVREIGATGAVSSAYVFDPSVPVYDEDGNYSGVGALGADIRNPVGAVNRSDNKRVRDRIFGNLYAEYTLLKDFVIKTDFGYDWSTFEDKNFNPRVLEAARPNTDNELTLFNSKNLRWINTTSIRYDKTIGVHKILAFAGTAYESYRTDYTNYMGREFLSEKESGRYPDAAEKILESSGMGEEWALQSYMGRLDYSLMDRYLFSANFRADGSSKFRSNNRWGYFPSFSGGWRISEESFFGGLQESINNLKFRASWGQLGNQMINEFYPTYPIYTSTANGGYLPVFGTDETPNSGYYEKTYPTPDLKWEVTTQTDFGIDMNLFGKFELTFDYFTKKSKDILLRVPVPALLGVNDAPYVNSATVRNRGFEVALAYNTHIGDLNINAYGNFSQVKNEVLSLGSGSEEIFTSSYRGSNISRTNVGNPMAHFYGYKTDGIFRSQDDINNYKNGKGELLQPQAKVGDLKYVDADGNGTIDGNDRTMIGSGFPDMTYGFGLDMGYKGFDLSLFFQGVAGSEIFNALKYEGLFVDKRYNQFADILDRFHPVNNPNGSLPHVTVKNNNNIAMSDLYVEKGDYLRLKNLTIGYTFDKELLKSLRIQKLRLYVTMQNLLTFTSYKGLDPELGEGGVNDRNHYGVTEIGVDRGQFAQPKTFIMGLNINF